MPNSDAVVSDRCLLDPGAAFRQPEDVLKDRRLKHRQKVEILCRWAYDATELAVAEEEGMGGGEADDLDRVLKALLRVAGRRAGRRRAGPTKHAGACLS